MNFKCDDATAEKSSRVRSPPSSVPGRPGTLMTGSILGKERTRQRGKTKKSGRDVDEPSACHTE